MVAQMLLEPLNDAHVRLGRLSPKERELLDQILQHKSLKVIAHDLGVTPSAVDQRLKSARMKLGAADRNDAARRYSGLLASCRESTYGFQELGNEPESTVTDTSEPPSGSTFTFHDSATIEVVPSWFERRNRSVVPDFLDENVGRLWRVIAIPVFAVAIAMLALALMAMAKSLSELL
jgi:DNA-binding CsgD family transcriptional regulator